MYGQPVYKYEINENHEVMRDFGDSISAYSTDPDIIDTLPSRHQGEVIVASARNYGVAFSQTEKITYLPRSLAGAYADAFRDATTAEGVASLFLGWAGIVVGMSSNIAGVIVSVFSGGFGAAAFEKSNAASAIDRVANNGDDVRFVVTTNSRGTFYNASSWDGKTCVRYNLNSGLTHYTIDSVVCGHNSNPWS